MPQDLEAWRSLLADAALGTAVRKAVRKNLDNDQMADVIFQCMLMEERIKE